VGLRAWKDDLRGRRVVDDVAVSSPPVFSAGDRPASIVDGAGRWLAPQLGSPYRWLSGQRLVQAAAGPLMISLELEGSPRNRTGESTTVSVSLLVDDEGLLRWRDSHPDLCYRRDGRLIGTYLENLVHRTVTVELYGTLRQLAPQILSLTDLPELVREILSVLPCLDSPARAVREMPATWRLEPNGLVEWALSRGDSDSAKQMIQNYLSSTPAAIPAFQDGMSSGASDPGPVYNSNTALGRLAVGTALLGPEDHMPAFASKRRRTFLQRIRGDQ
jgi:hypothetical protein